MATDTLIPILPCLELEETLTFYRALGFEVTHEQTWPYQFGSVHRRGVDVYFHRFKGRKVDPAKSTGACVVLVDEVESLHQGFVDGLRRAYGRLPVRDIPRIGRCWKGQTRFGVVDPAGNTITFIRRDEDAAAAYEWMSGQAETSHLAQALGSAYNLRVFQNNDSGAARVLDVALRKDEPAPAIDRARALAARAELAVALGETERGRALRDELQQVTLSDEEREPFRDELEAADRLARALAEPPPVLS